MASEGEISGDNASTSDCGFEGNSDLYGLGIRLGLYVQYLTASFLWYGAPISRRYKFLNGSIVVWVIANIVTLFNETSQRSVRGSEVMIVIWALLPQILIAGRMLPTWRLPVWILMLAGFYFYQGWFWFKGLDLLPRPDCGTEYVFFFARVDLRGWFRTFSKVMITIPMIGLSFILLFVLVWVLLWSVITRGFGPDDHAFGVIRRFWAQLDDNMSNSDVEIDITSWDWIKGNVLLLAFFPLSATGLELTIHWNNISGVNTLASVSQLFPFVLSLGTALYFFYTLVVSPPRRAIFLTQIGGEGEVSRCPKEARPDEEIGLVPQ